MHYVIEVIKQSSKKAEVCDQLHEYIDTIISIQGLASVELFEKNTNIRDADYDFLMLSRWVSEKHYLESKKIASNIVDTTIKILDSYQLQTEFGEVDNHDDGCCWLINPFEVTHEQIPDVIEMWDKAKDHLIIKPTFVSARLFQAMDKNANYGLVNIAQWRDAKQFLKALEEKEYEQHKEKSLAYRLHASLCKRIVFYTSLNSK